MVAAWISALTGVGPAMASGSQTYKGICADLPVAPTSRSSEIAVKTPAVTSTGMPFTWVITVVTQTLMLLINLAVFHARGMDTTALHTNLPLAQNSLLLLYHLVAIDALWYAPIWAWLLLISAWARRTPLLWAILPPFALTILEAITLHTSYVSRFLTYRLHGPAGMDFHTLHGPEGVGVMSMSPHFQITPAQFLATPGLWIGLALAAIFLAAAIQLRRYRNPL